VIIPVGESVEGREIKAFVRPGPQDRTTVVFGGFHGDEPKSVHVARELQLLLERDASEGLATGWVIVPVVNPDGLHRRRRRNGNLVDINRNFPTQNWQRGSKRSRMFGGASPASEPETKMVMDLIERHRPMRIVSIHSIDKGRECNNFDGPGEAIAEAMSRLNGYPVAHSIGYPTPGSFGTWAGVERGIATITLELPSRDSKMQCWLDNREALLNTL
jgi:murein peptide amidase A